MAVKNKTVNDFIGKMVRDGCSVEQRAGRIADMAAYWEDWRTVYICECGELHHGRKVRMAKTRIKTCADCRKGR